MQLEAASQIVPDVPGPGIAQVAMQVVPVGGMGAAIDDAPGSLSRGQPTQIGKTVFRNDDLHRVFVVIDMRAHRNDRRDFSLLGDRGANEDGKIRVAGKVAAAADAVDHRATANVSRVDVTVEVDFQRGIRAR